MEDLRSVNAIHERMTLRTSGALQQTVVDLVTAGVLRPGDRLPTVREMAEACGMSRSAVGEAWRALTHRGLIETRRRGGTWVLGKPAAPRAQRYESMMRSTTSNVRDLANIRISDHPYPDLSRALVWSAAQPRLHDPFGELISPELAAVVAQTWPFAPERFAAAHGAMDALELALSSIVRRGDAVLVESPAPGRLLDIVEALGARAVPVNYGPEGLDLEDLRRGLVSKPVVFVYQPCAQIPSGRSVTAEWVSAAAELLPATLPVIEISQLSLVHDSSLSLGSLLPGQVTQIRSYNICFGADMRMSVVGGTSELIEAMWMKLTYSTRFVSRILQGTLTFLLSDEQTRTAVAEQAAVVKERHRLFRAALEQRGLDPGDGAGPGVWLAVPDEHSVCTRLSQRHIAVHPGRFFVSAHTDEQHVLINSAAIAGDHEEIADLVADACRFVPGWGIPVSA